MPVLNEHDAILQKISDSETVSGEFLNDALSCFHKNIMDKPTIPEMLEDYRKIRADYVLLDKQLREANSKNDELKETMQRTVRESFRQISELTEENQKLKDMLEVACEDFDAVMGNQRCIACANYKGSVCDYTAPCVWQHRDEALELIFGKEHEDGRSESEP